MNVEVIVEGLESNPQCFHGPCLLFRRNGKKIKEYFACSACRDRKECPFYLETSGKRFEELKNHSKWIALRKKTLEDILSKNPYKKYLKMLKLLKLHRQHNKLIYEKSSCANNSVKKNRKFILTGNVCNILENNKLSTVSYCYTCEELFDDTDLRNHVECNVLKSLTEYQLKHPTEILVPKEDSKTHAQYFFSKNTVANIVLLLSRLKVKNILCIGVPRIHEYLVSECKSQFQSMLLDIDIKYYNFYNDKQFIWYNMFNNFILKEDCVKNLEEFLQTKQILVLMDPPFGGRVEPLAFTLNALNKLYCQVNKLDDSKCDPVKIGIMWIFPYFMERHIKESLPDFNMFDLKIDYENHSSFTDTGSRKRKFGSPVRIFTNIPLPLLDLSGLDGYKYCNVCNYWVSDENRHCKACNACTSKNGQTYVHCRKCSRCVKPSYQHCEACGICTFLDHVCGQNDKSNCFSCKQPGHKKRDCPKQEKRHQSKKRRANRSILSSSPIFNGALKNLCIGGCLPETEKTFLTKVY